MFAPNCETYEKTQTSSVCWLSTRSTVELVVFSRSSFFLNEKVKIILCTFFLSLGEGETEWEEKCRRKRYKTGVEQWEKYKYSPVQHMPVNHQTLFFSFFSCCRNRLFDIASDANRQVHWTDTISINDDGDDYTNSNDDANINLLTGHNDTSETKLYLDEPYSWWQWKRTTIHSVVKVKINFLLRQYCYSSLFICFI